MDRFDDDNLPLTVEYLEKLKKFDDEIAVTGNITVPHEREFPKKGLPGTIFQN